MLVTAVVLSYFSLSQWATLIDQEQWERFCEQNFLRISTFLFLFRALKYKPLMRVNINLWKHCVSELNFSWECETNCIWFLSTGFRLVRIVFLQQRSYMEMLTKFTEDLKEPFDKFMRFTEITTRALEDICGHCVESMLNRSYFFLWLAAMHRIVSDLSE